MLDNDQIAELKSSLIQQQRNLLAIQQTGSAGSSVVELDQSRVGRLSRMDALQAQAMSQATQSRRELQLQRIATALRRIECDEYGFCTECGEEIALKRLRFDPATSLCFDCANDKD